MRINKNFLQKDYFKKLQKEICGPSFPWYHLDYLVSEPKDEISNFYHLIYQYSKPNSEYFKLLEPLIEALNPIALIRIRINFYIKSDKVFETNFHTDVSNSKENYRTAILYLNTNNGFTKFKNKKVKSEENTLVDFEGHTLHSAVSATDDKKILININYYESSK
tara:strand:+ start:1138 stop:1629 length:492 start_codon:yes stop_codon:yes gene_type:complete